MVEHNLGVSMLSEMIIEGRCSGVQAVPIVPEVSRSMAIAVAPDKVMTLPMKRLISITKEYIKQNYHQ